MEPPTLEEFEEKANSSYAIAKILFFTPGLYAWWVHDFWIGLAVTVALWVVTRAAGVFVMLTIGLEYSRRVHNTLCIIAWIGVGVIGRPTGSALLNLFD